MNILLLVDKPINRTLLGQVTREVGTLYKNNCDIDIKWHIEERDFTSYPKELYMPGFEGMGKKWLADTCAGIYKRWAEEIDCVVFMPHSDNWNLEGVWGWNMSATFSGYGVQQVRFAQVRSHTTQRNVNNSIGTLYHELHHDHDTFVFNYTGKRVESMVDVRSWDNDITHGEHPDWQYIRLRENQASIKAIAPLLKEALAKRRAIFDRKVNVWQKTIQLLERVLVLQRELLSRQRGDIAILENNKCSHG